MIQRMGHVWCGKNHATTDGRPQTGVHLRPRSRGNITEDAPSTMERSTMLSMGKSTLSMVHGFNSYVKLPEGSIN